MNWQHLLQPCVVPAVLSCMYAPVLAIVHPARQVLGTVSCYLASLQVGPARGKPFSADFLMAVLDWASRQQREQQRAFETPDLPPSGTGVQQPAAQPIQVGDEQISPARWWCLHVFHVALRCLLVPLRLLCQPAWQQGQFSRRTGALHSALHHFCRAQYDHQVCLTKGAVLNLQHEARRTDQSTAAMPDSGIPLPCLQDAHVQGEHAAEQFLLKLA